MEDKILSHYNIILLLPFNMNDFSKICKTATLTTRILREMIKA